ncbi:hypothetical protein BTA51_22100 [Hahella sp. CCB-MM4]|uniref:hypothetical protein n=1 Tax=Hahella sp. (strain CCB-MM4) TaxID=1926491 RepID=UPI000B9AD892|nr:hypothetical protein [Hahella sp. CCB-MM4]OZG71077.1 hypothetical protein BTA51_22100 [Hahella sp. CCB-MM4]
MENIESWACSFSGCDGGYLSANTWLCGIEWGGGSKKPDYYEKTLPEEIKKGSAEVNLEWHDWADSLTYPYGISFAKLYQAIKGRNVEDYQYVLKLTGKELFKMNLYPIAFDSTDHNLWHQYGLDKITGFKSKFLFNTWCFFNRFPFFAELRRKHNPKLIICTGIDYLRDFLMFFGGNTSIERLNIDHVSPISVANSYDRQFFWVKLPPNTLLVVVPFFSGRYGLNSNYLLQEIGAKIKSLLDQSI